MYFPLQVENRRGRETGGGKFPLRRGMYEELSEVWPEKRDRDGVWIREDLDSSEETAHIFERWVAGDPQTAPQHPHPIQTEPLVL